MCFCSKDGRPSVINVDYISSLMAQETVIKLVVMGRDPYPSAVTDVPFMKPTWSEMGRKTHAGFWLVESITGSELPTIVAEYGGRVPQEYAKDVILKQFGVALLNVSYCFRKELAPLQQDVMTAWNKVNCQVVTKALAQGAHVLLCGPDAWKAKDWIKPLQIPEVHKVWHPKQRNSSKLDQPEWLGWWQRGAIKRWLGR